MAFAYSMRISRLTIDKLGVKLYDKVSAVIAELIANAYDADATTVTVAAPMGQFLATRAGGAVSDKGFEIRIADNGIGMTPQQVQDFFLVVGADRRSDSSRGGLSPRFKRKVMGRKGVGKLAPFGICKTIEVISAGGDRIEACRADPGHAGYLTSHIILDYGEIVGFDNEPDERYRPTVGDRDETQSPELGTEVILKDFNYRRVPHIDILARQLAQRFGIKSEHWRIQLVDSTQSEPEPQSVGQFNIQTMPNTRLTFQQDGTVLGPDGNVADDLRAGFDHDGEFRPVTGWMAYSKTPYKDDLMAGVRIYCRGKIAAQTFVFNQRAGFTGEHNIRSYLVGEIYADWLDEEEDLIRTDRRDILWSDELAVAFQEWGRRIVKRIGGLSRDPLRKATLDLFLEKGGVEARILSAYPNENQEDIRGEASKIARALGRTISRREVEDADVVGDLVDLSITLAPHQTLNTMMKEAAVAAPTTLSALSSFLFTARLAELSSFGRIAEDRLKVVARLESLKDSDSTEEGDLQQLLADAPWLINPEWELVTENRTFSTLRSEFEKFYERNTGRSISLSDFRNTAKRPDFVLFSQAGTVQIIEIKRPDHMLSNTEMERIVSYHDNMKAFLESSAREEFRQHFPDFHITVVCDRLSLTGSPRTAFEAYRSQGRLTYMDWATFLLKSQRVHEAFLIEARRQRTIASALEDATRE